VVSYHSPEGNARGKLPFACLPFFSKFRYFYTIQKSSENAIFFLKTDPPAGHFY